MPSVAVSLFIFDLDGTLIDSKQDIAYAVNLTFRDLMLPEKPEEVIYGYVGNGVRQLIIDAVETTDPQRVDQALAIFDRHYQAHLLDQTDFYPGILQVLEHFKGGKKAIVTNKPAHYTTRIMDGLLRGQTEHYFDFILGGSSEIQLKPHPEMLLKTLDYLQTDPGRAVMIGDSLNDLHAARAAGVRFCAVGYGFGDVPLLKEASPDFFVTEASDLIRLFH